MEKSRPLVFALSGVIPVKRVDEVLKMSLCSQDGRDRSQRCEAVIKTTRGETGRKKRRYRRGIGEDDILENGYTPLKTATS